MDGNDDEQSTTSSRARAAANTNRIITVNADGLCEDDPQPRPYAFEKELIEAANKHIHLYKTFVPVTKVHPLASKFYACHEQYVTSRPERFLEYAVWQKSERRQNLFGLPRLESQVYGWLPRHVQLKDAMQLNYMQAPKQRSFITQHAEKLIAQRITERTPFNGLRFILH